MKTKLRNEYVAAMGEWYDRTPKAVFAAITYSYGALLRPNTGGDGPLTDSEHIIAEVIKEWDVLHKNGIVPQKPVQPKERS